MTHPVAASAHAGERSPEPGRRPLRLAAFGMGGSVAETLEHVMRGLAEIDVASEATLIDLQSFHLRAPGRMTPPAGTGLVRVTPRDVGYATPLSSMTLNLALSGGRFAHRRMIRHARRCLADIAPDVLLCCHDRFYIETAFVAAAKQLGIPTVLLQEGPFCVIGHGTANSASLRVKNSLAPAARALGLMPNMPDYGLAGHDLVLAASEQYRQAWTARGVPAERIRVAGIPRYDVLPAARRNREPAHPGATAQAPVVMVLIQPFGAHGKVDPQAAQAGLAEVGAALDALAGERPVDIRVRQHPRSEPADAASLTAHLSGNFILEDATTPFPERAQHLDLVVGFYSSAILEALAVGVPCAGMWLPEHSFAEPGEAAKQARLAAMSVPFAHDRDALYTTISALLDDPARTPGAAAAESETGPLDGCAGARAATGIVACAGDAHDSDRYPASSSQAA